MVNPTPRLRFVERETQVTNHGGGVVLLTKVRIIQQWWAYDLNYPMTRGEWRDVPLEKE